jgi:phosphate transport system ATP-binding protein
MSRSTSIETKLIAGEVRHSAAGESLMAAQNLTLHYGDVTAFRDVTMLIPHRRITALIGPSGCGKSSFLYCLGRLVDHFPTARMEGRVWLGNSDIYGSSDDMMSLRRQLGVVFQKPAPFPFSVRKNMELALREHGVRDRDQLAERVESSLRRVGLWNEIKTRLNKPATALSGGQQQRLVIARALALQPQVLLMDEPCSALDPIASGIVEDLIAELGTQYTIVLVTHNLAQARRVADDVAFFWVRNGSGTVIEHATAEELFEAPANTLTKMYVSGARG